MWHWGRLRLLLDPELEQNDQITAGHLERAARTNAIFLEKLIIIDIDEDDRDVKL